MHTAVSYDQALEAFGEVMGRGLALQGRVHRQHDLVEPHRLAAAGLDEHVVCVARDGIDGRSEP